MSQETNNSSSLSCEEKFCLADKDYRSAFDLSEDTITIYVKELEKHTNHICRFLFEDKVMIMGMKDGIIQLWRETDG